MKQLTVTHHMGLEDIVRAMIVTCFDEERVTATWNGIDLIANATSTRDGLLANYDAQEELVEGRSYQKMQATFDACMTALPTLDFGNHGALLSWFADLQPGSDSSRVKGRKEATSLILTAFTTHGYRPLMNQDATQDSNAKDMACYIIGQCLHGLNQDGPVHQAAHEFIKKWHEKFQPAA